MDRYSILDPNAPPLAPETDSPIHGGPDRPSLVARETIRFPGDDGGKSLAEMALRDLDAALQLLAERAQYITGASGAALALRQGADMICRASAGASAPELGAHLQIDSGLSGESVRTRQILRCNDAETDTRVNRESCRDLGIASVMVMPLTREDEVFGVFELFSDRPHAFEDRDVAALQRLAEMIQTAVEHAESAARAQNEIDEKMQALRFPDDEPLFDRSAAEPIVDEAPTASPVSVVVFESGPQEVEPLLFSARGNIRKCEACGFPVSEGRILCLDCEAAGRSDDESASRSSGQTPEFLSQLATAGTQAGWFRSNIYLIGIVLVMAATAAVLLLRFR